MKLTQEDLYTVVRARNTKRRSKREVLALLGCVFASLIIMLAIGPAGLLVAVVFLLGWTAWFLRVERRYIKGDKEEAAGLYAELPTAMRAESVKASR